MPDRSHVKQSIPCKNRGCGGFAKCEGGSKVKIVDGHEARVRQRKCDKCGRITQTAEIEIRVINAGRPQTGMPEVLQADTQKLLF